MPRRYADYPDAFAGWNFVSSIGSYIFASGLVVFIGGVIYAFVHEQRAWGQSMGRGRDDPRVDAVIATTVPPVQRVAAHRGDASVN